MPILEINLPGPVIRFCTRYFSVFSRISSILLLVALPVFGFSLILLRAIVALFHGLVAELWVIRTVAQIYQILCVRTSFLDPVYFVVPLAFDSGLFGEQRSDCGVFGYCGGVVDPWAAVALYILCSLLISLVVVYGCLGGVSISAKGEPSS